MKRPFFFIMIAFLGLIYYSAGSPMEIADRVMIHAIGIDTDGSGYSVTMQVFSPEGGGSETAIDPSKPNVTLVKGRGSTVSDAVHGCEARLGGHVFIGQNRVIIFGKDIDLSRTDELFGYFLSSSEAYLNTDCAACGSAEKLLSLPIPSSGISSDKFVTMIRSECERGCAVGCTLMQLLEDMDSPEGCAVMPEFSVEKDSGGEDKDSRLSDGGGIVLDKAALFRGGKYAGTLEPEQAGLVGMISGTGESVYTVVGSDETPIGKTFRVRTREVSGEADGDELIVRVKCTAEPADEQYFPEGGREGFNSSARKVIEERADALAEELCCGGFAEILGAEHALRRYFPEILRGAGSPDKLYSRLRFDISVA